MPADHFNWTDNFFKKMTDMESPKKNNDCYFYYYSTCSKGDSCSFRHEPSALGCETMCSFWKEGKCLNIHCNFRHMELRKNRKAIPCYWESQPVGCLKPHCPFMHLNPRQLGSEGKINRTETPLADHCTQAGNFKSTPSVDSVVVNFEEESDNESAPSSSPDKSAAPKVKTLEEIKLEKIAAECAAYYSYPENVSHRQEPIYAGDLRQKIINRVKHKPLDSQNMISKLEPDRFSSILGGNSLELQLEDDTDILHSNKRRKMDLQEIRIKTLDEIRAERPKCRPGVNDSLTKKRKHTPLIMTHQRCPSDCEEAEVSSTSTDEPELKEASKPPVETIPVRPIRKLNLEKIKSVVKSEKKETLVPTLKTEDAGNTSITENHLLGNMDTGENLSPVISKTLDESLLLLEEEEEEEEEILNVNAKSEDDLLNDIDALLNNKL